MNLSPALLSASLVFSWRSASRLAPATTGGVRMMLPSDTPLSAVSIEGYGHVSATLDFVHAAVTLPLEFYHAGSPSFVLL